MRRCGRTLAEAHAALGHIKVQYEYDWVGAEREYKRAIELDPNSGHHGYALLLSSLGRHEEAETRDGRGLEEAAAPDAGALVHSHSVHATAWSFLGEPLDTGTEELDQAAGGAVLTAPFAPTGSDEIAAAAVEALGDRRAVLLGRHGVLAAGDTPAKALDVCVAVERQAQIALLLR